MNNTFTPSRLARLAYHAMVENAALIQERIVKQEAINARFGDDALAVEKILRGYQNNLRDGEFKRRLGPSLARHAEYIAAIREFEKLFEIEEQEDMEAFAHAFKERMRDDSGEKS